MYDATRARLQGWWMAEIKRITRKVMAEEDKRQERIKKKNAAALADYRNEHEIRDAYGCGFISERKCEKLLEMYEETYNVTNDLYEAKINLLQELYQEAKAALELQRG